MRHKLTILAILACTQAALSQSNLTIENFGISYFNGTNDQYYTSTYSGNEQHLTGSLTDNVTVPYGNSIDVGTIAYGQTLAAYSGEVVYAPGGKLRNQPTAHVHLVEYAKGSAAVTGGSGVFPHYATQGSGSTELWGYISSIFDGGSGSAENAYYSTGDFTDDFSLDYFQQYGSSFTYTDDHPNYEPINSFDLSIPLTYDEATNTYRGQISYSYSETLATMTGRLTAEFTNYGLLTGGVSGITVEMWKKVEVTDVHL